MNSILRGLVVVPGLFFTLMGLRWLVSPEGVANTLGMPLLEGAGRSTQIADMAVFFLATGIMILVAAVTLQRRWFLVPALMMLGAAVFRIFAWLVHDAELVVPAIGLEVVVACLLLFALSRTVDNG